MFTFDRAFPSDYLTIDIPIAPKYRKHPQSTRDARYRLYPCSAVRSRCEPPQGLTGGMNKKGAPSLTSHPTRSRWAPGLRNPGTSCYLLLTVARRCSTIARVN